MATLDPFDDEENRFFDDDEDEDRFESSFNADDYEYYELLRGDPEDDDEAF